MLHREDIKAAIRKRGGSQRAIARELGVNPSLVSNVLAGRDRSARVEWALAEAAGVSLDAVQALIRRQREERGGRRAA